MRSRLSQPLQQIYRTLTAYRRLVLLMAIVGIVLAQQAHGQTALAIDTAVSTDRSTSATTIATPAFSTHATNELLLAFVSADDVSAGNTVTGGNDGTVGRRVDYGRHVHGRRRDRDERVGRDWGDAVGKRGIGRAFGVGRHDAQRVVG